MLIGYVPQTTREVVKRTIVTGDISPAPQPEIIIDYRIGYIDVFKNGVKLPSSAFVAGNGTSVFLLNSPTDLADGDEIEVISYSLLHVATEVVNGGSYFGD